MIKTTARDFGEHLTLLFASGTKKGGGGDNDLENKYRISKLDMDREVVETGKKKKKKSKLKIKMGSGGSSHYPHSAGDGELEQPVQRRDG